MLCRAGRNYIYGMALARAFRNRQPPERTALQLAPARTGLAGALHPQAILLNAQRLFDVRNEVGGVFDAD